MKKRNLELRDFNENEYIAQQESNLDQALGMGLSKDEFELICNKINKIPNQTELGIFSAMLTEY